MSHCSFFLLSLSPNLWLNILFIAKTSLLKNTHTKHICDVIISLPIMNGRIPLTTIILIAKLVNIKRSLASMYRRNYVITMLVHITRNFAFTWRRKYVIAKLILVRRRLASMRRRNYVITKLIHVGWRNLDCTWKRKYVIVDIVNVRVNLICRQTRVKRSFTHLESSRWTTT